MQCNDNIVITMKCLQIQMREEKREGGDLEVIFFEYEARWKLLVTLIFQWEKCRQLNQMSVFADAPLFSDVFALAHKHTHTNGYLIARDIWTFRVTVKNKLTERNDMSASVSACWSSVRKQTQTQRHHRTNEKCTTAVVNCWGNDHDKGGKTLPQG